MRALIFISLLALLNSCGLQHSNFNRQKFTKLNQLENQNDCQSPEEKQNVTDIHNEAGPTLLTEENTFVAPNIDHIAPSRHEVIEEDKAHSEASLGVKMESLREKHTDNTKAFKKIQPQENSQQQLRGSKDINAPILVLAVLFLLLTILAITVTVSLGLGGSIPFVLIGVFGILSVIFFVLAFR